MDTLLIVSDTITSHVVKVVDKCQPCVLGTATNCNDVIIVGIVCLAIVLVALIAWGIICSLKSKDLCAKEKDKKDNDSKEEEERKKRTDADSKQQKIDLQNKLLTFLEKNTSKGDYNKDKQELLSTMKDFQSEEVQYYIQVLKALIADTDIPDSLKK